MSTRSGGRHILLHGLILMLVGLLWGVLVPETPYPRLALAAHIQFVGNGTVFILLATLLLTLPHRVGPKSLFVMVLAAWVTWVMPLSAAANAWWGATQMLPIAAEQAGAPGAAPWQELLLKLTHIAAGTLMMVAWLLLIVGFLRERAEPEAEMKRMQFPDRGLPSAS